MASNVIHSSYTITDFECIVMHIKLSRSLTLRMSVALMLMRLAAWVLGCDANVTKAE